MDSMSAKVRLWGNLQAASADLLAGTMEERGRGFASDKEAWAELKSCIETTKSMSSDIEKLHKEMWSAVKDLAGYAACGGELQGTAASISAPQGWRCCPGGCPKNYAEPWMYCDGCDWKGAARDES